MSWLSSPVQRPETKARARALQLLYAWDLSGRPSIEAVVARLATSHGAPPAGLPRGPDLAAEARARLPEFDTRVAAPAADPRPQRRGARRKNIPRPAPHPLAA